LSKRDALQREQVRRRRRIVQGVSNGAVLNFIG